MFYGIKSFFSSSITIGIQTTVEYTADKCISKVKIRMRFLAKYITVVFCSISFDACIYFAKYQKFPNYIGWGIHYAPHWYTIKHVADGLPVLIAQSCQCMIIIRISVARLGSSRSKN